MSNPQIHQLARTPDGLSRFQRVPFAIYEGDRNWVAPILSDQRMLLDDRNPFFQHARMALWVVSRGRRDVGRIAAIVDDVHNRLHPPAAFFGFFECIDDAEAAAALLDAAADWARRQGLRRLLGPLSPTLNDEAGLLIEGLDRPPVVMMPYNPPFYRMLIEGRGFTRIRDLLALVFDVADSPRERLERIERAVLRRNRGLVLRTLCKSTLDRDLSAVMEVYNAAWERNWGFVPMTADEVRFMARRLRPLLVPRLAMLVEDEGKPVGFFLALPDYNQAFKPLRGRLLTPRLLGALPLLMGWKPTHFVRLIALGVKPSHRQRGIESLMLAAALRASLDYGFRQCEVSWVLEENLVTLGLAEFFSARVYKRYRIYECALT